ncbi:MAG: energy transducer TonB, partial [Bacteroidota bacterium]
GIPIPIPEADIDPERTIPVQEQSGNTTGVDTGTEEGFGTDTGGGEGMNTGAVVEELPPEGFLPVEKYPVAISSPSPAYPDIARRSGIEGTVFVKMWVTKDGSVRTAEVVKSSSELFDQAALDAARRWKFTPAIMNNGPVSVFVTVPFKFRLHQQI